MATDRAFLLIADIGGYTRFMTSHRLSLSHAQYVITRLLEAVLDAARSPLRLSKLEGDAAFFYAPVKATNAAALTAAAQQVAEIRRAFLDEQRRLDVNRLCICDGCTQVAQLTLKFVAHVGEVALHNVRGHSELAGIDVIVVHRMLKNDVPLREYVLMTEPVYRDAPEAIRPFARPMEHDFEGVGRTPTYYVDLNDIAKHLPHELDRSKSRALLQFVQLNLRALPYLLGLRKPCDQFRNLPAALGTTPTAPVDGAPRSAA